MRTDGGCAPTDGECALRERECLLMSGGHRVERLLSRKKSDHAQGCGLTPGFGPFRHFIGFANSAPVVSLLISASCAPVVRKKCRWRKQTRYDPLNALGAFLCAFVCMSQFGYRSPPHGQIMVLLIFSPLLLFLLLVLLLLFCCS